MNVCVGVLQENSVLIKKKTPGHSRDFHYLYISSVVATCVERLPLNTSQHRRPHSV